MNSIELKTLGELSQYSFYIPTYQRGYRWTEQEVTDLLNDINEFIPREISDTEEKTWYCLQPVVVKSRCYDDIISNFIKPENMENWQFRLIKEESLLFNCNAKYIAIPQDRSYCYLLKGKRPSDTEGCRKIS